MKEIFERGNMVITKSMVNKKYTWHVSRVPVMRADPEGMIELADAIYGAEGIDLRSQLAAMTAERDKMRKAMFGLKEYINTVRNSYLAERKSAPKDDIDAALLMLECLRVMVDAALESEGK